MNEKEIIIWANNKINECYVIEHKDIPYVAFFMYNKAYTRYKKIINITKSENNYKHKLNNSICLFKLDYMNNEIFISDIIYSEFYKCKYNNEKYNSQVNTIITIQNFITNCKIFQKFTRNTRKINTFSNKYNNLIIDSHKNELLDIDKTFIVYE